MLAIAQSIIYSPWFYCSWYESRFGKLQVVAVIAAQISVMLYQISQLPSCPLPSTP